MPFLVATDLDGTLLRRDFTVSERTRAALVSAAAAGVEVVYATGRPPRWLAAVYETTGYRPITVCANGALTLHGDQALHVEAIPEEVAEEVREVLLQQRTDFVFRSETWRGHTLKLLAVLPDVDQRHADTVLQEVRAAAGHLVEPTHSTHSHLLIEMGPGGVTKANAVQRLREQRWPGAHPDRDRRHAQRRVHAARCRHPHDRGHRTPVAARGHRPGAARTRRRRGGAVARGIGGARVVVSQLTAQ